MSSKFPKYVIDTNVFRVLEGYYPSGFPSFWKSMAVAVAAGLIVSVEEVAKEIDRGNATQHIADWVKTNKKVFGSPTEKELSFVREIFDVPHFQALVGQKQLLQGTPVADPFLIACAKVSNGCVVTQERLKPNSAKIPSVCQHFDVDCINLEELMSQLGWQF